MMRKPLVRDVLTSVRRVRHVLVSWVTGWVARACLYPYAFLLGIVSIVTVFQVINLIRPPYIVRTPHSLHAADHDKNPGGPPVTCGWNVLLFSSMRTLSKHSEFESFVPRLRKVEGKGYRMTVTCSKPNQIPCTLNVVVSANISDIAHKDAVVFGLSAPAMKSAAKELRMESPASFNQLRVLMTMLSPHETVQRIPGIGQFPMHLAWTYLSASQMTTPYAYYSAGQPLDGNGTSMAAYAGGKRKLVAWMGNNCGTDVFWPRDGYLRELKKHISVDMYGECANLTCLPRNSEQCAMLMGQYKFFLAFENAECREYVTEPFWFTALLHRTVPVVYGPKKDTYLKLAPPMSFIHVSDFESPKALAAYLKMLDKNDGLYERFFKWRQSGTIKMAYSSFKPEAMCKLLPYIEYAKIGKLTKKTTYSTKWFNSCRNSLNSSTQHDYIAKWSPWK